MSENPISISNLNDFIFCPVSIYFHMIDTDTDRLISQDTAQINGSAAHEKSDNGTYSDRKTVFQSLPVYSEKYNLYGKIDVFDAEKGRLTERKKKIVTVYDGYVFQMYGQYFALTEMGYKVDEMYLYSMDSNKKYFVPLPRDDTGMLNKFEALINAINSFDADKFTQKTASKCQKCIYEPLCSFSLI